jgi:hypothetical protein
MIRLIQERKQQDNLILLAITHNPHTKNPKRLWRLLEKKPTGDMDNQLDIKGLEKLKKRLNKK